MGIDAAVHAPRHLAAGKVVCAGPLADAGNGVLLVRQIVAVGHIFLFQLGGRKADIGARDIAEGISDPIIRTPAVEDAKGLDRRACLDTSGVPAEFYCTAVAAVGKDTRRIVRALDRACIAAECRFVAVGSDARSLLAGHSAAVAAPLIASARRNAGGVPLCRRYASTVGAARVGAVVICFIPSHSACGSFADYLSAVGAARENVIQKGGMSLAGQSACIFAGHGAAPVVAVCHCDASSAQKAARIISAADRQVFSNDITQLQRSFALYSRHKATAA